MFSRISHHTCKYKKFQHSCSSLTFFVETKNFLDILMQHKKFTLKNYPRQKQQECNKGNKPPRPDIFCHQLKSWRMLHVQVSMGVVLLATAARSKHVTWVLIVARRKVCAEVYANSCFKYLWDMQKQNKKAKILKNWSENANNWPKNAKKLVCKANGGIECQRCGKY